MNDYEFTIEFRCRWSKETPEDVVRVVVPDPEDEGLFAEKP